MDETKRPAEEDASKKWDAYIIDEDDKTIVHTILLDRKTDTFRVLDGRTGEIRKVTGAEILQYWGQQNIILADPSQSTAFVESLTRFLQVENEEHQHEMQSQHIKKASICTILLAGCVAVGATIAVGYAVLHTQKKQHKTMLQDIASALNKHPLAAAHSLHPASTQHTTHQLQLPTLNIHPASAHTSRTSPALNLHPASTLTRHASKLHHC